MTTTKLRAALIGCLAASFIVFAASPVLGACTGEELGVGTRIDASNLETVSDKCFFGSRVGDLVHEKLEVWMRRHGAYIRTGAPVSYKLPYRIRHYGEKYKGRAQVDGKGIVSPDVV